MPLRWVNSHVTSRSSLNLNGHCQSVFMFRVHFMPPLPPQLTTRRRSRRRANETRRWRDGGAEGKEGGKEMSSPVLRKIAMRLWRLRRRRRRPTRTQKAERDTMVAAAAAAVGSRTMLSLSVGFFSPGREGAPHRNRILLSRRSDSPEIEIATFPFFSSTFATPYSTPLHSLLARAPKIIAPLSFRRRAIREGREEKRCLFVFLSSLARSFAGES